MQNIQHKRQSQPGAADSAPTARQAATELLWLRTELPAHINALATKMAGTLTTHFEANGLAEIQNRLGTLLSDCVYRNLDENDPNPLAGFPPAEIGHFVHEVTQLNTLLARLYQDYAMLQHKTELLRTINTLQVLIKPAKK